MGETQFASWPVAIYGIILFFSGAAYSILTKTLISSHSQESALVHVLNSGWKEGLSIFIYALAIPLALIEPLVSCTLYIAVTLLWLVPNRRIEKALHQNS